MKKILVAFGLLLFASSVFAIDCGDMDEKLVILDNASKLDTNIYDEKGAHNKIEWVDYKLIGDSYTGGRWSSRNKQDSNLNVSGFAICIDNDEYVNITNINRGPYCWCRVEKVDNYRVSGNWEKIKEFNRHKFDETKYEGKKDKALQKKKEIEEKNIQDCMDNCATACQDRRANLIHKINGFYNCGRATYKIQDARCVIDNKFVHAKSILIFDDMAEIQMLDGGSIVFKREENNKLFDYVGKYQGDTIYLRLKNKQIFVGRNKYSAKECL